jgi:hypothetical protein
MRNVIDALINHYVDLPDDNVSDEAKPIKELAYHLCNDVATATAKVMVRQAVEKEKVQAHAQANNVHEERGMSLLPGKTCGVGMPSMKGVTEQEHQ